MSASAHDPAVEDIIESLDRTQFLAQNVHVGDNSSFQQTRNVTFNLPGPGNASPPEKIFDVPDNLSPYFLGREIELKQIRSALGNSEGDYPARCIVYGMPGMGKTQIALKYASTANQERWYDYIFWISATSPDKFIQAYAGILHQVAHPTRHASDRDIQCKATKAWLEAQGKTWLLILDNIQKETLMAMHAFMPQRNFHGHILCTTRTVDLAEGAAKAHGQQFKCLELSRLATEDAIRLLTSKLDTTPEQLGTSNMDAATDVVTSAGCLPLVVSQAASYIQFSRQSLREASQTYRAERAKILDWPTSESSYEGSLASVYSAALKNLQKSSPTTVDLLRLLVFLDPEGIPLKLIRGGGDQSIDPTAESEIEAALKPCESPPEQVRRLRHEELLSSTRKMASDYERKGSVVQSEAAKHLQHLLKSQVELHRALRSLQDLSIVSQQSKVSEHTLWLHDLVQELLLVELMQDKSQHEFWLARTVQLFYNSRRGKEDEVISISDCDLLAAQATSLKKSLDACGMQSLAFDQGCYRLAWDYLAHGRHKEAETFATWHYDSCQMIVGPEHPINLKSMLMLGMCLAGQSRYIEAEQLLTAAVKITETVKRDLPKIYLASIHRLSYLYDVQGREADAAALTLQSLEGNKILEQLSDPDAILQYFACVSDAYLTQLRYQDAEAVSSKALRLALEKFGPTNYHTITCKISLSECYHKEKRFDEAEVLLLEAKQTCEDSPLLDTALYLYVLDDLGLVYFESGRFEEYQDLQERLLEKRRALYGPYHAHSFASMRNLVDILRARHLYIEAISLQETCVQVSTTIHGEESETTQQHIQTLAALKEEAEAHASEGRQGRESQQDDSIQREPDP